ncbi:MAG: SEC-C domain-containing protein, partial [Clostridia bacterium]|nr:SEC-C domain-containing protein [Clostridia bacterium]
NMELSHHIQQAIKAHGIMHRDIDYIVKDEQIIIVDEFTGRLMMGRRFNDGLHQAIEAKEGVVIQKENRTIATITFQNYFRMYGKLSGMTGTALSEEEEFRGIYNLDVVEVPTNKPMIRRDHPDAVFKTANGKDIAIIRQIKECHEKGQPVLVGTVSIEKSEALSAKLKRVGIPHTVLNAKYHDKEADIVAQAGRLGAVTISTNMAGRGTDILLGGNAEYLAKSQMRKEGYEESVIALATGYSESVDEETRAARAHYRELYHSFSEKIKPEAEKVCEAGGLFVIGTERHESRRIDNQLRGRSGRQGDPGESRFFLSFEDDLMRLFGTDRIIGIVDRLGLKEDEAIDVRILSDSIESAQKRIENQNYNRRKNVLAYDDVMNEQRTKIYAERSVVLENGDLREKIISMIKSTVSDAVSLYLHDEAVENWDTEALKNRYRGLICGDDDFNELSGDSVKLREEIRETLVDRAIELFEKKENEVFGPERMREVERILLLRNVDEKWMDHLEAMDSVMETIGLQAYAQRNPISEYRLAAAEFYDEMLLNIRDDTVRMILSVMPQAQMQRVQIAKPITAGFSGGEGKSVSKRPVVNKTAKVGRNDPCPCGSGKKYKKCCGMNTAGSSED